MNLTQADKDMINDCRITGIPDKCIACTSFYVCTSRDAQCRGLFADYKPNPDMVKALKKVERPAGI